MAEQLVVHKLNKTKTDIEKDLKLDKNWGKSYPVVHTEATGILNSTDSDYIKLQNGQIKQNKLFPVGYSMTSLNEIYIMYYEIIP